MGCKTWILCETYVLCVLLILDVRNVVSGCRLFNDAGDVNLDSGQTVFVGDDTISDDETGLLYTYSTEDVTSVIQGEGSTYLEHTFDGSTLNILLSESYKDWEKIEDEYFSNSVRLILELDCKPGVKVEFRAQINTFTNGYAPTFPKTSYEITLPMPLPAGYTLVGECGSEEIEATDYDYNSKYMSSVVFSLKETIEDLEVTALQIGGKKWGLSLKTKNTFQIEKALTLTVVARDVPPEGRADPELISELGITIKPDIAASTPASPLFSEPIYILDIREAEDIKTIETTLVEGYSIPYEVELVHAHGEDLTEFFDTSVNADVVTLTPKKSFADTEFSGNFGVLILEAKHPGTSRIGKTVIHITLPGNYVTSPPTSTTESTILPCSCPTEETTHTADTTKPTEESTQCPEVTCPEVTCPTEPTVLPCTCPTEETTFTSDTTKTTANSTYITDTTIPTEGSTQCPEVTSTAAVTTPCPEVTCASETTVLPCTCPPTVSCPTEEPTSPSLSTSGTTESCVCTTENTSDSNGGSTTTTVNTHPCEPCECTSGTTESSTAPPQEKRVYFRDPEAVVYIYQQQTGYIKTMSAFCIQSCKIGYEIVAGPLSDSLHIDHETGDISLTENITQGGLFYVKAVAVIEGNYYDETATVHLNVFTLQPCQDGSQWTNTIAVKHVKEGLTSPYIVENCDFGNECNCALVNVIPEKARGYFTVGREVILSKTIDREDKELFPDQSNTDIILHLDLNCKSNVKSTYKFWDDRSRSVIDDIGNIQYDASRTIVVLRIEDENDNRPQFDIISPLTLGYPSVEIADQLLPPYLTKIQATDVDLGENAIINYRLTPNDQFFIHQETGVIYPVARAFKDRDTQFTVYASDSEGDGKPLEVHVKTLSQDNLLVIRQTESVLEDVDAVIEKISSITRYNIKLLSAAVIASDTDDDDDDDDDAGDRKLNNFKSRRESSHSLLQLIIYGLDNKEKPLHYSDIQKQLGETDFKSDSWTASTSSNKHESNDTGLLIGVIVLAVIIALLLGGAGVGYLLYIRSVRKSNDDYYDEILGGSGGSSVTNADGNQASPAINEKSDYVPNVQFSSTTEVIQPSAPVSPHLSGVSTTKPDQEHVPDEFHYSNTDFENTGSNGDVSESEEEEEKEEEEEGNYENVMTRRKSVVTFNDNVERIEIEEV